MNVLAAFGFDDLWLVNLLARQRKIFRSCWSSSSWLFFLWLGRYFSRLGLCVSLGSCHVLAFSGFLQSRLCLRFLYLRLFWTRVVRILWFSHNLMSHLNFAGFGFRIADHADGFARSFARSGIC